MKSYLTAHLAVALHASIVIIILIASAWYIDSSQREIESQVLMRIDSTLGDIQSLAVLTDGNGADALTERIVSDCPRRNEFDGLLAILSNATKRELIAAQQLFESCGAYYAERKALMVAQLEREYRTLDEDLLLLETLRNLEPKEASYRKWQELVKLEDERSALLTEQTTIQAEIIELLLSGDNNERIQELVRQAQNVAQSLTVIGTQIDTVRANLMS